jgi:hypothetical protein
MAEFTGADRHWYQHVGHAVIPPVSRANSSIPCPAVCGGIHPMQRRLPCEGKLPQGAGCV